MITKRELREHLKSPKFVSGIEFTPVTKSRNLPRFVKFRSRGRVRCSDILDAGDGYRVMFVWRSGPARVKRLFSAWLFLAAGDDLVPLARLDYHPSHKGIHIHVNCDESRDHTNRMMPGCKSLNMKTTGDYDPDNSIDRQNLVGIAMDRFNIEFWQADQGLF
ncbi:hypothetical protein [Marinobacter sp. BGYM27]|uniref:hypothetical protein n=1 Tax=Marinobacter sp. BGYM27 TaxID=2975597 RepID=UPI0021A7E8F2|nr:hypothetical protein [Marinobacter sp. BGYM27]MDG5498934.1 hypothetical protein [Marinobacter sp. BGYM27]